MFGSFSGRRLVGIECVMAETERYFSNTLPVRHRPVGQISDLPIFASRRLAPSLGRYRFLDLWVITRERQEHTSSIIHMANDSIPKFRTAHLDSILHQAGKIIGHRASRDGADNALEDEIGGFVPAQITEHHLAR